MRADNPANPDITEVNLGCGKCGASLPADAHFCLKCGEPVSAAPEKAQTDSMPDLRPPEMRRARSRRRFWLLVFLLLFLVFFFWALTSENPLALEVQELAGFKQDRSVLDSHFTIGPHTFRDYKFALPEGSVNVALVGEFTSAEPTSVRKDSNPGDDNGVEVFVLTEAAFAIWQNGYATSSVYDSGKVHEGKINVDVPEGPGIYYLVFSNRASQKTATDVRASVLMRYKSWLPESVRRLKQRVDNWFEW